MTDLATTISDAPSPCYMRTGTVVALLGASQVTVDIGGGQLVDMPALTQYEPILGDVVMIQQQGPVQIVLGRTAPLSGDNALTNPSFELDAPGSAPSYWTSVVFAGGATVSVNTASGWGSVTGTQWLEVNQNTPALTTLYVVSEPIPVQEGELWTAAGWAHNSSLDATGGYCQILLSWYGNATDMYPTTASTDTAIQAVRFPPGGTPSWALVRQIIGEGAEVPGGVSYMRVLLNMVLSGGVGATAHWDAIVCRKLRGV